MNRRNRSFLLIVRVLIVISLALAVCGGLVSCKEPPEWGENVITLIVGELNGSVAHRSEPYVIVMPDGRQMPAPAVGTEFTVAVDTTGTFVVQAHAAPEPIIVYEPDGVTPSFKVPQEKEVTTPAGGEPSPMREIEPIDPHSTIKPAAPEAELEMWHSWAGEPEEEILWAAVEQFHERYPQIEIRMEGMERDALREKYAVSAAAGVAPDLVLASSDAAIEWAAQGFIQPLDDVEEEGRLADVYPAALDTLRYEGRLWGIPIRASTVALYYNRELFDEWGLEPPSTTDELRAMVQEGYATLALPNHIYYTYGFLEGYGGQLVDEGGNVVVESEGTYAYLNFIRDLVWSRNVRYGPAGEVQPLFQDYEAAMIIDGVWMLPAYRESLGEALGVALLPRVAETGRYSAPVLSTDACLISAAVSDADREAAVAFALFLTGEDFQAMLVETGNAIPINMGVRIDDAALFMFFKQANLASPGPLHPERSAIWEIAQRMQERVFEEWSPEEAAKNAAAEMHEAGMRR
ncbi:MAG: hypothetical protein DRI79_07525 [Chloroflexi bacterium]|mgnify:CR=1 FL=1|nr:MAG: hypothetical protein DRI80_07555 [Chloroflexota bacterium]RLC88931.1 MAG: hypothetical protein DRI79_07525 [Chloroflexota bacterium]